MASFKMKGLDKLEKQLKQMERNAKELNGSKNIPLSQLFPASFMKKYTSFSSVDDLFEAGGFKIDSQSDFDALPSDKLDKHIAATTKFRSWEDMLGEATSQYVASKLGF